MSVDAPIGIRVVCLSGKTRPFVLVLVQSKDLEPILKSFAHLGVGCATKEEKEHLYADI